MKNKPIELDAFDGHLILYCKGWYRNNKNESFFEGLKKIWAIRCGYDYNPEEGDNVLQYIANSMFGLIIECEKIDSPDKIKWLMDVVHKDVSVRSFKPTDIDTPIKDLIYSYRGRLMALAIRDVANKDELIKLPKPMKRVFNRILNGNGRYGDYKLIKKL